MNYEDINWHDGVLTSITFEAGERPALVLKVKLAKQPLSLDRKDYRVCIFDPERIFLNLDVAGLIDNQRAGNISDGKIFDEEKVRIILVLNDGYLEATGSSLEIKLS